MGHVLVIAVGNVARGDDGVAHDVTARLTSGASLAPGARVLAAVGLDVAMAEDVARAERLVVIDAERRETPLVMVEPIEASAASDSGHAIDAPGLLAVTAALWGKAPPADLVSLAAPEMGHGEGLSATAKAASVEATTVVLRLLRER